MINSEERIKGGYFIISRKLFESDIQNKPPCFRETWIWLLGQANHSQGKSNNKIIERGQLVRTILDIQKGLCWYVGYRKQIYSKTQITKSLRYLCEASMIDTTKTTRGLLITICNYDYYQQPKNYEDYNERHTKTTRRLTGGDTINNNDKNNKNEKNGKNKIYKTSNFEIMFQNIESNFTTEQLKLKESFIEYWTEPNQNKTKERWQMEKTFEIKRRFNTWLRNNENWGFKNKSKSDEPAGLKELRKYIESTKDEE